MSLIFFLKPHFRFPQGGKQYYDTPSKRRKKKVYEIRKRGRTYDAVEVKRKKLRARVRLNKELMAIIQMMLEDE